MLWSAIKELELLESSSNCHCILKCSPDAPDDILLVNNLITYVGPTLSSLFLLTMLNTTFVSMISHRSMKS